MIGSHASYYTQGLNQNSSSEPTTIGKLFADKKCLDANLVFTPGLTPTMKVMIFKTKSAEILCPAR